MKKGIIAIGLGLTLLASSALATPSFAEATISKPKGTEVYDMELKHFKAGHIANASAYLQKGNPHYALWHLDRILEKHDANRTPKFNFIHYGTLEEVKESIEEVVNLNLKDKDLNGWLFHLAETLYEEEKINMVSDKFKQMLDNRKEILENTYPKHFKYVGSNFYHMWLIYSLSLKEARLEKRKHTTVLDATVTKVLQAYTKEGEETVKGIGEMFASIKVDLPKEDSELMKKIKSASSE